MSRRPRGRSTKRPDDWHWSIFDDDRLKDVLRAAGYADQTAWKLWRYVIREASLEELEERRQKTGTVAAFEGIVSARCAAALVDARVALITARCALERFEAATSTSKLLVELQDGAQVETVVMRYAVGEPTARATACVSSQLGCGMGCKFCATGTMALQGQLTAAEIVEQLVFANAVERRRALAGGAIRNVVFMGEGEPLDNIDAVLAALRAMTDVRRFGLSPRRVCISTVGVVDAMRRLVEAVLPVQLALSLHAPTQALRERIVPSARQWPLTDIIDVFDEWARAQPDSTRSMIEYVMIAGVNDGVPETARALGRLLRGMRVMVNLIPYNKTDVPDAFEAPSVAQCNAFARVLRDEFGMFVHVRRTLGQSIDGACGQLVIRRGKKARDDAHEQPLPPRFDAQEEPLPPRFDAIASRAVALGVALGLSFVLVRSLLRLGASPTSLAR